VTSSSDVRAQLIDALQLDLIGPRTDHPPHARYAKEVLPIANIHRRHQDQTASLVLVRELATRIRDQIWPGKRLPEVFYDPRSLETEGNKRAVLHAKTVVVDGRFTLLTSANFTEAAHERNIEAGVMVDDPRLAERVTRQFDHFVEARVLRRVSG
jgi:phosphatidylserine/phosphatidylglycerophosphate/cardiolipin synthase-like enzyme